MANKVTAPPVILASAAPVRSKSSNYPEPFASQMSGRVKRPLGDMFGIASFGVNHVTMSPGAISSLFHQHNVQDEFVIVMSGELTLIHDDGETPLTPGMCAGFKHAGTAHQLVNRSREPASYVEVGDRRTGDSVRYPQDDLVGARTEDGWSFTHKDGRPY